MVALLPGQSEGALSEKENMSIQPVDFELYLKFPRGDVQQAFG